MIKYNSTYDRWVTDDGLVYRQDKSGAFVLCKQSNSYGYLIVRLSKPFRSIMRVHRLVWETFKGTIPSGYELDHKNTIRNDNRLENLRCVTHIENDNNPLSRKHKSKAKTDKPVSDFGQKYFEHYGYLESVNKNQYNREHNWYRRHNKVCSWE